MKPMVSALKDIEKVKEKIRNARMIRKRISK
jgi:hypothetical protein